MRIFMLVCWTFGFLACPLEQKMKVVLIFLFFILACLEWITKGLERDDMFIKGAENVKYFKGFHTHFC